MSNKREPAPFPLGFNPATYNPSAIQEISDKELKSEYARLRAEANSRLRGFERSAEFVDADAYKRAAGRYVPIAEIESRRELEMLTIEASRFVTARASTVSGQRGIRQDAINTLKARGINFVNTKNFKQFGEFMEWARLQKGGHSWGSPLAAQFFDWLSEERANQLDRFGNPKKLTDKSLHYNYNKYLQKVTQAPPQYPQNTRHINNGVTRKKKQNPNKKKYGKKKNNRKRK